ncbi:MAG: hypothetical protein DME99_01805, partial [Verrucomicrobia bacterium]
FFAAGEADGSSLPDCIIVGRTGATSSDFGLRDFGSRDALVFSARASTGLAVPDTFGGRSLPRSRDGLDASDVLGC